MKTDKGTPNQDDDKSCPEDLGVEDSIGGANTENSLSAETVEELSDIVLGKIAQHKAIRRDIYSYGALLAPHTPVKRPKGTLRYVSTKPHRCMNKQLLRKQLKKNGIDSKRIEDIIDSSCNPPQQQCGYFTVIVEK